MGIGATVNWIGLGPEIQYPAKLHFSDPSAHKAWEAGTEICWVNSSMSWSFRLSGTQGAGMKHSSVHPCLPALCGWQTALQSWYVCLGWQSWKAAYLASSGGWLRASYLSDKILEIVQGHRDTYISSHQWQALYLLLSLVTCTFFCSFLPLGISTDKSHRSCSDAERRISCRLFSLPLSSSRWEEINTNSKI